MSNPGENSIAKAPGILIFWLELIKLEKLAPNSLTEEGLKILLGSEPRSWKAGASGTAKSS